MIGKLKGVVDEIGEDSLILDVGGVGYHVFVSRQLLARLEQSGGTLTLFVETQMREDAIRLFGFMSRLEQEWFRLLQQVQGVGAKVALGLLGALNLTEIAEAIALKDVAILTRAPGVGKKVAERIITELKSKTDVLNIDLALAYPSLEGDDFPVAVETSAHDAISALANLGYGRTEATQAVAQALKQLGNEADAGILIRTSLQFLSRSR